MPRGSVRDVLNSKESLPFRLRLKMALDAATGMNYLHHFDPPIMHRDLKSHNLLVDANFSVKVFIIILLLFLLLLYFVIRKMLMCSGDRFWFGTFPTGFQCYGANFL